MNRKRKNVIFIRTTDEEHKKIMEKVAVSKMSINRFFINAALKREIIIYDLTSIFELSAQISRIGNNINQIAKKLNQGGLINKSEIKYLKNTMENINEVLIEVYQDIQATQDKG
ncbi:plasmid mobilization protein [Sedimentibacter sp. MB31-C6]|uniref:plasmid mobilization protein n=1 Tax=Sedimentibacter sp. MB31-C6 TaxID=3109366 RepID=UPI002DDDB73D|nr:plasmid mobilization relaxosome protein MobC [Sedimentibacter sp. MB36-C1]WSI05593.1 plasmid mobilization relaxosome protein MobC [Sedimentibacter sp. MB36-C1]